MNKEIESYALKYFDTFCNLFEIGSDGNLNTSKEKLLEIEKWYNNSYLMVSLITGIPLSTYEFNNSIELEDEENQKILMHIYSVSYTVLLRFSSLLKKDIPIQFRSTIV